jgi:hypothetical protein
MEACHHCTKPLDTFDFVDMLTTGMYRPRQAETPGSYFNAIRVWHRGCVERRFVLPALPDACPLCGREFGLFTQAIFLVSTKGLTFVSIVSFVVV